MGRGREREKKKESGFGREDFVHMQAEGKYAIVVKSFVRFSLTGKKTAFKVR